MPSTYIPKKAYLNPNKIQKIAKTLIEESGEDRKLALDAHAFFRRMVDENPQDSTAKALMVDALKVAQASKNNVIKVLNLVVKMEDGATETKTKASKGAANSAFFELENQTLLDD